MTLSQSSFKKIKKIVGTQACTRKIEDLALYAYDATAITHLPDAVVFPENASQIASILKLANQENFYVIPRGSGSGMTGGSIAIYGGVVLVMNRMNRIITIDTKNLTAIAEPGVITKKLHDEVAKYNLFYPPDPSSSAFSTLGGNLAECAGGPHAVKYGVTRDYVLGLEAVLPTGEIIQTGVQTKKGVAGYDLTRLLVGSEGTLCVITRIILRLIAQPETVRTMTAFFPDIKTAITAVTAIIQQGIMPRTLEFMDQASINCVADKFETDLPTNANALLIIEVDGSLPQTATVAKEIEILCRQHHAIETKIARTSQEAESFWKARKSISPALFQYGPHKINEDIVVPVNKLPDIVQKISELKKKTGLTMVSFGHAGDGNIHFNIMLDKRDKKKLKKAEKAVEEMFDYTLALGGTISGEHGIGITKAPFLTKEIGKVELALMKKIKNIFDPKGVLNPGKIF